MKRWGSSHRRRTLLAGLCLLAALALTSGCGPGLLVAGGGSAGAVLGLQSGDDDDDGGGASGPSNVLPAVVVTELTREESPAAIEYTILDPNQDLCSVEVEYALGAGPFTSCQRGNGGDNTVNLTSSAAGEPHTFAWDFESDLGPQFTGDITIRIRASDDAGPGEWFNLDDQVIGNDAPVISNILAVGTDTVLITFDMADQNGDQASINLSYSTDQGQSFTPVEPAEIVGNPPESLQTSPGGSPGQFVWDSGIALLGFVGEVLIRFETFDEPPGYDEPTVGAPVVEGPFDVDNSVNGPPELTLQSEFDGATHVGEVPIEFTLEDEESDAAVVHVEYSLNDGANWSDATLVGQFSQGVAGPYPTGPSPSAFDVTWNARADIGGITPYQNSYTDVLLRFTPGDSQLSQKQTVTEAFKLTGNLAPEVLNVEALQNAGNIPVLIELRDENADPVSVDVEYSTDGSTYVPLSAADFAFGDPSDLISSAAGHSNVLVWDTTLTFDDVTEPRNAPAVTLRVTPTDDPSDAPAAVNMTGAAMTSPSFAIVNDPGGADPVNIDIFTTDAGGAPTANPQVTAAPGGTVYLDREVSPSSAVVQDTFWRIEQPGEYGSLVDVGGGVLSFATGSITCDVGGAINDGDTFTVHDGLNSPVTFEFDNDSSVSAGNVLVGFDSVMSAEDVADEVSDAINASPSVRITAETAGGGVINLEHEFACGLGNAVGNGGNADDITFTGAPFVAVTQLGGGTGTDRVRFEAPASPPAGSEFVTLTCAIDDAGFFGNVHASYRLYWGDPPASVSVSPSSTDVLVESQRQFSAQVSPAAAPQRVTWRVVGGTSNGTISEDGLYTAPASVPSVSTVIIEAASVDPNAPVGTASVTILPEPASVVVDPPNDNPPEWEAPDLLLDEAIQFTETVLPGTAPDDVNWRVIWNGQDWGSGNATVGTVNASGVFIAPGELPSPDQVTIQAVSQVKPSVYGGYSIRLKAPPPTDFEVDPDTETLTAGGAGRQFQAVNFLPSNANKSVQWEISPLIGHVDSSGYYTPPESVSQQRTVTLTARSSVASTVAATATITVDPNPNTPPTSIEISPAQGVTYSGGASIKLSATVLPTAANQSVSWSFVGGIFGAIDQSGEYTPAQTDRDRTVTLRCQSAIDPQVFDTVVVRIAGDGQNWVETDNVAIGRAAHTVLWDSHNQRQWIIGGQSELTENGNHTLEVTYIDHFGAMPTVGAYDPIGGGASVKAPPNTVTAAYDSLNDRILAVLGAGNSRAELWELDVTGVPTATWQQITAGTFDDVPSLTGHHRVHCWFDVNTSELQLMVDGNAVFRFDATGDQWRSRVSMQGLLGGLLQVSTVPTGLPRFAHAIDDTGTYQHYFIGAEDGSNGADNVIFTFNASSWRWGQVASAGDVPPSGLRYPSAYFHNGDFHVFGGQLAGQSGFESDLYSFSIASGTATWQLHTLPAASHTPNARGAAFFGRGGATGAYLIGGGIRPGLGGVFGDLWRFNEGATEFKPFNPDGVLPQGRAGACGAVRSGESWLYGGVCEHGVSDELWRMSFVGGAFTWTKVDTSGDRPPPLRNATMVYDSHNDVMVMFGGNATVGDTSGYRDDTWVLDTSTGAWTHLSPGATPSARHGHAAAWDPTRDCMWIYGGRASSGLTTDVWRLDLSGGTGAASWTLPALGNSPPDSRAFATLGYDDVEDRVLMMGGDSSISGPNRQLYGFDIATGTWAALPVLNASGASDFNLSSGVHDPGFARFLHAPPSSKQAQAAVMASSGASWQTVNPPANTNARGGTGLYDPAARRYYSVFGLRTAGSRQVGTNISKKVDFN